MTRRAFEKMVRVALRKLPKEFGDMLQNVDVVVEEEPDARSLKRLRLGGRGRLLGLYEGVPLKDRTQYYGMVLPDKITLFKKNILRTCTMRGLDVGEEIAHVVQHEIAHHFGISDKRLKELDVY